MLIPGLVKFTEHFQTMFIQQIELSGLPFSILSQWGEQIGEIITGLIVFFLVFFNKTITPKLVNRLF